MGRPLSTAVATALGEPTLRLAVLAEFDFSGGITRYWSGKGDLVWNTYTWLGLGNLGGISAIEEASGTQAPGVRFDLSGIPSAAIAVALTDDYQGRSAKAWLVLFDTSDTLIADPILIFSGVMDVMQINDGGQTATITLNCEGRNIDLSRNRELRYTDTEQQRLFAGDRGLEYVAGLQDKQIAWGVASARGSQPPRDRDAGFYEGDGRAYLP